MPGSENYLDFINSTSNYKSATDDFENIPENKWKLPLSEITTIGLS